MRQATTYWAADPDIGPRVIEKVQKYREECDRTGILGLWRRLYRLYYGQDGRTFHSSSQLVPAGQKGELTSIKINHFRSVLTTLKTLATQQRPAWEARAGDASGHGRSVPPDRRRRNSR